MGKLRLSVLLLRNKTSKIHCAPLLCGKCCRDAFSLTIERLHIMADKIEIEKSVRIESDSKSRVAYDLATKIAASETGDAQQDRQYWLTLYYECYRACSGSSPKKPQEDDEEFQ